MLRGLPLPPESALPMHRIARGVFGLRNLMVNVYAAQEPSGAWVLIDTGLPFSAARIHAFAGQRFGTRRPEAIVLTHGHFDHAGAALALADFWDVPIYSHLLEMPYLCGSSPYPPPDPSVGGGFLAAASILYPKGPYHFGARLHALRDDGSVPGLPSWRWIHTPGHTAGHISLFREEDRVLIAGDAFVTTKQESLASVATQRLELHGPPAYYTSDWEAAKLSVRRLAGAAQCDGHRARRSHRRIPGRRPAGGSRGELRRMGQTRARALCANAAVTGDRGIVLLPPARFPVVPAMAALGVAAALVLLLRRNSR